MMKEKEWVLNDGRVDATEEGLDEADDSLDDSSSLSRSMFLTFNTAFLKNRGKRFGSMQ